MDKVKHFDKIVNEYRSDIDIMYENRMVDAKSIMGVLALDLSKEVYVRINSNDISEVVNFEEAMEEFS